jgi:alkylated DNA repair dioxygenase AlkB
VVGIQASLFDAPLETNDPVAFVDLAAHTTRTDLSHGAWVDVCRGWVCNAWPTFNELHEGIAWQAERRTMYDRVVDVPRLTSFIAGGAPAPHRFLDDARYELNRHYGDELGEDFESIGLCLYRDGGDSVAWHGDTLGRGATHDTMVAVVSLGDPRIFALRPRGGGPSIRISVHHGDLLVMGGSCQRTWEHCVPKSTRPVGQRISIQYRVRGVS